MNAQYPLILGASGLTGTEVVRRCFSLDVPVRVTYREQAELNTLRHYGIQPFCADFDEEESVRQAMKGTEKLIIILPIHARFETWGKMIIDCARAAGVRHCILLSNFVVNDSAADIAYMHKHIEHHLIESEIPYTIIRPATYFHNLLWSAATIIRHHSFSLPLGEAQIPHIDMRDVAEALVGVLSNNDDGKHLNKTYILTGKECLSMFEVARLLSKYAGHTVRYHSSPLEFTRRLFVDMGMEKWTSEAIAQMYESYATLDLTAISGDYEKICGKAPRSFSTFVEENIGIFAGKAKSGA